MARRTSSGKARAALVCKKCGARNYQRKQAPRTEEGQELTINKHCPRCNEHTPHELSK